MSTSFGYFIQINITDAVQKLKGYFCVFIVQWSEAYNVIVLHTLLIHRLFCALQQIH